MKIAVFGGAFNPPHIEHINMIKFLLQNGYDKVVVTPSNNPPHKNCQVSFLHRVNMLKIALDGIEGVEICNIEGQDNATHFSCEVIPKLKKIYGEISFVVGGDSLVDLHKWKNPDEIIKMCDLVVFFRGGNKQKFEQAYLLWKKKGAKIKVLEYMPTNISSTRLRYAMECGVYDGVDGGVAEYIKQNNLYQYYKKYLKILKNDVEENTFDHIVRVAQCALYLNERCRLKLDSETVFLAALLHDCAKKLAREKHSLKKLPKDCINTLVEHQFLGAIVAKNRYKIKNVEVLDAIKYHTTGKPNMKILEKLIFCADMIEEKRDFDGVEHLRQVIKINFEEGFRQCLFHQYQYLLNQNKNDIYPLTKEAVDYYKEN